MEGEGGGNKQLISTPDSHTVLGKLYEEDIYWSI